MYFSNKIVDHVFKIFNLKFIIVFYHNKCIQDIYQVGDLHLFLHQTKSENCFAIVGKFLRKNGREVFRMKMEKNCLLFCFTIFLRGNNIVHVHIIKIPI